MRVGAVGSASPILYDATVFPFSRMPQPREDQLDRDGDEMSDSWESRFGLDRYTTADVESDLAGDGFSTLEEFVAETDPII